MTGCEASVNGLTGKESTSVLEGNVFISPSPLALTDLTNDERDDSESSTQQCYHHQKFKSVDKTLSVCVCVCVCVHVFVCVCVRERE